MLKTNGIMEQNKKVTIVARVHRRVKFVII
jgi:hypothetical protein